MIDPLVASFVQVFFGAKRYGVANVFGSLIDQRALIAIKRNAFGVAFDKVLIDLRSNQFKQISKMPQHWKVAQNRMLMLKIVIKAQQYDRPQQNPSPQQVGRGITNDHTKNDDQNDKSNKEVTHINNALTGTINRV